MKTGKLYSLAVFVSYLLCLNIASFAQSNIKTVDFKGNRIGIAENTEYGPSFDGMVSTFSGYKKVRFTAFPDTIPVTVNGSRIFKETEVSRIPRPTGQYKDIDDYIFINLQEKLARLEESTTWKLHINNVVIDTAGKIVYYECQGMYNHAVDDAGHSLWSPDEKEKELMVEIKNDADSLLADAPLFRPAKINGQPVPYVYQALFGPCRMIHVRKNKAYLTPAESTVYRPRRR